LLVLLLSPLERISYEFAEFSEYIALAGLLCMIATTVVAFLNFRNENNATSRTHAFVIALVPFAVWLVLYLFDTSANVHGVALPALLLYTAIAELSAVALLIATAVRAIRRN
jgi:hypothetical protein